MKKYLSLIALSGAFLTANAQTRVFVWKNGSINYTDVVDSVTYTYNHSMTFDVKGIELKMIKIKAGAFYMGSQKTDKNGINYNPNAFPRESPVHKVNITEDYYMAETEVTQALWKAVMGNDTKTEKKWTTVHGIGDNYPAYFFSDLTDMDDFMQKLNTLLADKIPSGYEFGFPTHAQWEYAGRACENTVEHWWSNTNNADNLKNYVCYGNTFAEGSTCPVKQFPPNAIGLYGMCGNIFEYTADYNSTKSSTYYTADEATDPYQPYDQTNFPHRIACGGTYNSPKGAVHVTYWDSEYYLQTENRGFRIALYKKRQ